MGSQFLGTREEASWHASSSFQSKVCTNLPLPLRRECRQAWAGVTHSQSRHVLHGSKLGNSICIMFIQRTPGACARCSGRLLCPVLMAASTRSSPSHPAAPAASSPGVLTLNPSSVVLSPLLPLPRSLGPHPTCFDLWRILMACPVALGLPVGSGGRPVTQEGHAILLALVSLSVWGHCARLHFL